MRMLARSTSWRVAAVLVVVAMLSACGTVPERPWIAEGQTEGRIVLAVDDAITRHAAAELQRHLAGATGVVLPIAKRTETGTSTDGPDILVGWGEEAVAVAPPLGADAYILHRVDEGPLLIGGPGRGTLYGVYAFLEESLGVRRFRPGVTLVPKHDVFELPRLYVTRSPAFPVRWLHMPAAEDQAWCDWHGIDSRAHRGRSWGMFVHTFNKLVPPEKHFADHPEYFSEINGKRLSNQQLCLTNEDVFKIVVAGLREAMAKRPDAPLWSVSQNDCFGPCECTGCKALSDRHGSQAGPLVAFVNRVAAEFPDKTISTLAYQYTRRAPRDLAPAPNVNICLCSIECDRAEPLADGKRDADFVRDVREWSALTKNLMIWDYVVQFSNYVSPFPNFHVLAPNIRLFRDARVQLMFQQGSGASRSDLSDLKQYVIAKLLWDPDRDVDALVDDFLNGCYGRAARHLSAYFQFMQWRIEDSGAGLSIYGSPVVEGETWLTPETLLAAEMFFDHAEEVVADQPDILARVKRTRLSVTYARLEQARRFGAGLHGLFEAAPSGGWQVKAVWKAKLDEFLAGCAAADFRRVHERHSPPEEYAKGMRRFFDEGMIAHPAVGRPVALTEPQSPKYPANGIDTLVDGIKGTTDYRYNWLGWEAVDTTITVDLGETREVRRVAADFLQVVMSWIWLPTEVKWSTSRDGETWEPAGTARPRAEPTNRDLLIERFESTFPARPVRYVRMEVTGLKRCPSWHHVPGGDAWFFCDEVMVFE